MKRFSMLNLAGCPVVYPRLFEPDLLLIIASVHADDRYFMLKMYAGLAVTGDTIPIAVYIARKMKMNISPLKVDVASQEMVFGPFVDKTDGVTAEVSITAPAAARIWKNGVTSTIDLSTGRTPAWTHDGDGYYTCGTISTDVNTPGRLKIEVSDATTHLPVEASFVVMGTPAYNALVSGAAPSFVYSPVPSASTIEILYNDDYDSVKNQAKLSWAVTTDFTGTAIALTIFDPVDSSIVYWTGAGVRVSEVLVTVELDAATFLVVPTWTGCPLGAQLDFALVADGKYTIAWGKCYVYFRP